MGAPKNNWRIINPSLNAIFNFIINLRLQVFLPRTHFTYTDYVFFWLNKYIKLYGIINICASKRVRELLISVSIEHSTLESTWDYNYCTNPSVKNPSTDKML